MQEEVIKLKKEIQKINEATSDKMKTMTQVIEDFVKFEDIYLFLK